MVIGQIVSTLLVVDDVVHEEFVNNKDAETRDDKAKDNAGDDVVTPKTLKPIPWPLQPFPQRLKKKNEEGKFQNFISMLKKLSINLPLIDALEQIPKYMKFMKDLVTKKRTVSHEFAHDLHYCGAIATRSLVQKKEDPGAFIKSCTIEVFNFAKALCDLQATINLVHIIVFK